MKQIAKICGVALVVFVMVYNLRITRSGNEDGVTLSYIKNVAQADDEEGGKYSATSTASGNHSVTYTNRDGTTCTESGTFTKTDCLGSGTLSCTASYVFTVTSRSGTCY